MKQATVWRWVLGVGVISGVSVLGSPTPTTAQTSRFLFGTAVPVPGITTNQAEGSVALPANGLSMIYSRNLTATNNNDTWDNYEVRRDSLDGPWSTPVALTAINTNFQETQPSLSPDGLTVYYRRDRTLPSVIGDIWTATRPSLTEPFGAPTRLFAAPSGASLSSPSVSSDGLSLYLHYVRPSGDNDIYVSQRNSTADAWGPLAPVPGLDSTTVSHGRSSISPDNKALFVATNSTSPNNRGGDDLAVSIRSGPDAPWSPPINLGSTINTVTRNEVFATLTADGKTLYVSSAAPGSVSSWDIVQVPVLPFEAVPLSGKGGVYQQSFNELGTTVNTNNIPLPSGWTFTTSDVVFNNVIATPNFTTSYAKAYNSGPDNDVDRALTVSMTRNDIPELQFRSTVTEAAVQSLQLGFDIEAWRINTPQLREAAFRVLLETDTGSGFVVSKDLGVISTGVNLARPADTQLLDGNLAANRFSYLSPLLDVNIPVGAQFRVRWQATGTADSLVFGLDNVSLQLFAVPEPSVAAGSVLIGMLFLATHRRAPRRSRNQSER